MARPKTVQIDSARVRALLAKGYGARRVADALGLSVSTSRRAIRSIGRTARGTAPRPGRGNAGADAPSVGDDCGPGSEPGSGPCVSRTGGCAQPAVQAVDPVLERARQKLLPFRGGVPDEEFRRAVACLAAEIRVHGDDWTALDVAAHCEALVRSGGRRARWLTAAADDITARWETEAGLLAPVIDRLGILESIDARADADRHRDRLLELLPRRLAMIETGDRFCAVVDELVAAAVVEHRAMVGDLGRQAPM